MNPMRLVTISLLMMAFHPVAPLLAQSGDADLLIYDDELRSPWINASWGATVTFGSAEQSFNASNTSIKVAVSAWGALSLRHGNWGSTGIQAGLYQSVEFAVHGSSSGATLSLLFENDAGQPFPRVNLGVIAPDQWTVITIPMNQLNPDGHPVHRLSVQEYAGITGIFYVDEARFVGSTSAPVDPVLASPANGTTGVETNPTIRWNTSSGASSYRLQVSPDSTFASTMVDQGNLTEVSYPLSGLTNSATYYWRVNAENGFGTSDWSTVWSFRTRLPAPILASPSNGANGVSTNSVFVWNASPGAITYRLNVDRIPDNGSADRVIDGTNLTDTSYAASGLSPNTTYYWRVNAANSEGTSDWSEGWWSFTTAGAAPAPPVLVTPPNFATGQSKNPTLIWRTSFGAQSYHAQVSPSSDFSSTVVDQNNISDTSLTINGLSEGTRYYWRINASNGSGTSDWSAVSNFVTIPPTPTLASPADGSTGNATSPRLVWNPSPGAVSYHIQVSTDAGMTQLVVDRSRMPHPTYLVTGLAYEATYFWRVRAEAGSSLTDWSATWSFMTIDASQSGWTAVSSGTTAQLTGVSFADANTGAVVGTGGTILRTTNGGTTWTSQASGTTAHLRAVSFTNPNIGTVVGDGGTILRTTDGGTTWISQSSGTTRNLTGVSFSDANTGTVVGDRASIILRTTDGGANWTVQYDGFQEPFNGLHSVSFTDATRGVAVGSRTASQTTVAGRIMTTSDGGATWTDTFAQGGAGPSLWLYGVSLHESNRGFAVGLGRARPACCDYLYSAIVRTTDGGASWRHLRDEPGGTLYSVATIDANTATAVGEQGTLVQTTDGGESWTSQSSGTNAVLRGVSFVNSSTGFAVGDGGLILRTTTGGNPPLSTPPPAPSLFMYDDALQSPWNNASWGSTITFGSSEQSYGNSATSVKVVASAWGALSLHYGNWGAQGIDPAPYQSLEFAVYATDPTTLSIALNNDQNQSFPSVNRTVSVNNWEVVSIPMNQLNPNGQTIHRLSLQKSASGTFYVDALRFVGAPQASAALAGLAEDPQISDVPTEFGLSQNYPNPFNPATLITYQLPVDSRVTLTVFNLLGQEIRTLVNGEVHAGNHQVRWDASGLPSGIYVYRLTTDTFVETKRMLLMK